MGTKPRSSWLARVLKAFAFGAALGLIGGLLTPDRRVRNQERFALDGSYADRESAVVR